MLVLHRRIGERLMIGEGETQVQVTVVSVKGNVVSLGIIAPKTINVHREEIYRKLAAGGDMQYRPSGQHSTPQTKTTEEKA